MPWTWTTLTKPSSRPARYVVGERLSLLRLLAHGRAATALLVVCEAFLALRQAAIALAIGRLVGSVESAARFESAGEVLVPLFVLGGLIVVLQGVDSIREAVAAHVRLGIDGWVRHTARLASERQASLVELADPTFQNDVTRAADLGRRSGRTRSVGAAAVGQLALTMRLFGGVVTAGVLAQYSVALSVAVFVLCLLNRAVLRRQWMHLAETEDGQGAIRRQVDYWMNLAREPRMAGEVRLFALGPWVLRRHRRAMLAERAPLIREQLAVMRQQTVIVGLSLVAAVIGIVPVSVAGVNGQISAAELMTYLTAASGMIFTLSGMGHEAFDIEYGRGSLGALKRLQRAPEQTSVATGPAGKGMLVEFEDVSFSYSVRSQAILDGCDLSLRKGEVVGIVGANGVGKSTLVMLMAGLLQPTQGMVRRGSTGTVPAAAVFQDFVRYPLTLRENIALAAPEVEPTDMRVMNALRIAGGERIPAQLASGLETLLQRDLAGGSDLSGGQWQRIAIARAIYAHLAGRELVILDEPTANLDVRAEAAFYEDVARGLPDATIVLISHRLSTVRHADRIMLLSGGKFVEVGSHEELVAGAGEYARLFALQASRFHGEAN